MPLNTMVNKKPKVVVVVGPTAAGKTSLSIDIAKQFNGEVISADSRQVYRGLDIGSGKVTPEEMGEVPHYLLDVADPMTVYTASDFKQDGEAAIDEIISHGHLPIIAGGTFFYVDALLGRISTPKVEPNPELREKLEAKTTSELVKELEAKDPERAATIDKDNKRRLVRALEIVATLGKVPEPKVEEQYETLIIGIDIDKEKLHHNIHIRLLQRLEEGMIDEVTNLLAAGVTHERLEALGLEYRYLSRYLRRELTYEEMVIELETKIRQFAKRQMTWLKGDKTIEWFATENRSAIFRRIESFLS